MSKKSEVSFIAPCPKCGEMMERRTHQMITLKDLKKPYIFSYWDVCVNKDCRMIQHYEHCKMFISKEVKYLATK